MAPPPSDPSTDLQRLLAEEPFVRSLAKSLVCGDADDVVQQTYLQALQQRGGPVGRPRSWLARIVRNVAANLRRGERRRQARQQDVAVQDLVPSSAELMEREERRRELVAAVDRLPVQLRTVVLLRWFEGLPPRRIAAALGVPVATVSTQLQRALAQLRQRLDAGHGGDRRAWLVPLWQWVQASRVPPPAPVLPLILGAIAMTTKTKVIGAAAMLLAVAGVLLFWPDGGRPDPWPLGRDGGGATAAADAGLRPEAGPPVPEVEAAPRQPVAAGSTAAPPTTGNLVVRVRHGDDHAPAEGVTMLVHCGGDPRYESRRQRTDASGTARFEGLGVGRHAVACDRGWRGQRCEIEAGRTAELDFELEVGLTVTGIVVDVASVPVPGALVEVAMMGRGDADAEVMATAGADGRFAVRAAPTSCLIGARAAGHCASPLRWVFGKDGNAADVRLELGKAGGMVEGVVVAGDGAPVADAVVVVGTGKRSGLHGEQGAPPLPALVRSDAQGRFLAVGVPPGAQAVQARAASFAPWLGTCEVVAHVTTPLRVTLSPGATVRGRVLDAAEAAVAGAEVEVGSWEDLAHYRALSAADGGFELAGLPAGEIELEARHDDRGRGAQRLHTTAGSTTECELRLSRGLELRGRVLDENGHPVAKAMLECLALRAVGGDPWFAFVQTDAEGRFAAANCPDQVTVNVTVHSKDFEKLRRTGVDPKAGELELRVRRAPPRSVRITGTVVAPDGTPVANAMVDARTPGDSTGIEATGNDGRFELGPLAPGAWRVHVRSTGHPEFTSEARELAADAAWDLGRIQLGIGGTAIVEVAGDAAGVRFQAVDAAETRTWSVDDIDGTLRTGVLAAGDYRLLVSGGNAAAQAVPFAIRAGAETRVPVRLQAGVRQRFEIAGTAGLESQPIVRLRVLQGSDFVGRAWASVRRGEPCVAGLLLLPGSYTVTAAAGALHGRAEVTVGEAEGAPLRIELR
jgi:RNA polymerase sigma-70 factor (ECF subfamily)